MASSSEAGAHSATAAEVFSTPPAPGWTENVFKLFRILVVCGEIPRLESVSSGLKACGYYVEMINSCDRTASSIAEQTSVLGINTQSVAGFMREIGVYAGVGPLVGQPSSFLAHIAVQEASALDVAPSDVGARDPLADA